MAEITLEPPISCDECNSINIELKQLNRGKWPYIYRCLDCAASVSCHPNTFKPMGLMANRLTRQLRKDAHAEFDKLWRSGLMTRDAAYRWLAEQLRIPIELCHISWLENYQLRIVIIASQLHFNENKHVAERRKAKRYVKLIREREYENKRIQRRKYSR